MREERLFRILGLLDEDLVENADQTEKAAAKWPVYGKLLGVAAAFILLASISSIIYHQTANSLPENQSTISTLETGSPLAESEHPSDIISEYSSLDLPQLTLHFIGGDMGFEGYMAHSYEELVNANPWNEDMQLTHLPVFKNTLILGNSYEVTNPDWDTMESMLQEIAVRLGFPDLAYERVYDKMMSTVKGKNDDISITVDASGTAKVEFLTPVTLPSAYHFTYYDSSYEDMYAVATYLLKEYQDFLSMEHPSINIYGGDYNIYGEQGYDIAFFDRSDDNVQALLNYHLNQISFHCNSDGKLWILWIDHPNLSELVGSYPIIDAAEAAELLKNGTYATTVPYDFPGEEYIRGCELIYRNSYLEEYYMPYYRFYVELPEEKDSNEHVRENQLNTYGAYYVPAIEGKYIENMAEWEIKFN